MVNYCYTANVDFTSEAPAEEVLKVADKYNLSRLRSKCLSHLCGNVDKNNIFDRLAVAELYDDKTLKYSIERFFATNPSWVYSSVAKRLCKRKTSCRKWELGVIAREVEWRLAIASSELYASPSDPAGFSASRPIEHESMYSV
ncbi:hypothetical protein R1sor_000468 [Riccia sorocarpa]|uniref:BTB domain-containing protein n=1 Tax=Riccia sorocarpa TaxID=122646 RepID=A0ABD3GUW6_9MARC